MYFIVKGEDLLGKEIVFVHFARFAEAMVIVTKDKGICVFDREDEETEIYGASLARQHILKSDYLRKELNNLSIITNEEIKEYEHKMQEERRIQKELWEKQREEKEYQDYLRLKEKFENVQS